jgi:hypothetical protein
MIKYAELDSNDNVVNIIISTRAQISLIPGEFIEWGTEETSSLGDAVISGTYDRAKNKFIGPKPYPSWVLNESDEWSAPITKPNSGSPYSWDEENQTWVELEEITIDL